MTPFSQQPATRAEINRGNAAKSTGPKTEAGKQRSRFNARRHNLTGQILLSTEEDLQVYFEACSRLIADLRPEGELEKRLAQSLADAQWQLERARAIETNLFFETASKHLDSGAENPEADTQEAEAPMQPGAWAVAQARAFAENAKQFDLISRYATRYHRQVLQLQQTLVQVQKERRAYDQKRNFQRHERQREALANAQSQAVTPSKETANATNRFVSYDGRGATHRHQKSSRDGSELIAVAGKKQDS